jgi:hypothetical protein
MSKSLSGSVFCAVLYSVAAVGSVAAQDVVQPAAPAAPATSAPPAANAAPAATNAPASGSVQSAPSTTVVQPAPAPAPTVVQQPAPAPTVVQQPAQGAQTPVVVEKEKDQAVVQQTNVDTGEEEAPSVFSRAAQGLLAGTVVGGASGYLAGRQDGWEQSDWRAVGLGLGVGALAGTGVGLMFGFMDKGGVRAGRYIPRDMAAGAGLGALVGVISGGIAAGATDDAEKVAFGAAVGVVAGAGLGIITGIVEGKVHGNREVQARAVASRRLRLAPSLAWARVSSDSSVVMPAVAGRF